MEQDRSTVERYNLAYNYCMILMDLASSDHHVILEAPFKAIKASF